MSHDQSCCISVIVPVYQAESYLPRCMESIRLQTWQSYEVILVDDGSLDAGGALCDSYAQQDARIRVIHQENRGLSAARNAGIKKANGEWVAFVDADDAVAPSYLETLYQAAVMKHCDISQCGFEQFDKQLPESTVWDGSCCVFSGEEMQWRIYSSDRQIYLESVEVGQQRHKVAFLFDGRTGRDAQIHTHLSRYDIGQRGFAESGRAV